MVKQFKGEVKISDVQAEFDALVGRINKMVDAYNGTNQVITNIDYTKGGSNLAPSGYTLTVGGIKQALKSLDGHVVGGKCFYDTANTVKMSDGLLFTKGGVFRLPDSILTRPSNGNSIWFDTNKKEYVWGQKRVSGRQTLTEEGATSLVKSGEGYKNTSFVEQTNYQTVEEHATQTTKTSVSLIDFCSITGNTLYPKKDGDIGIYGNSNSNQYYYYIKSCEWRDFDLRKYPHKSIPLESTEVEFNIMRSGDLTYFSIDGVNNCFQYSGSYNGYAILGYYQDNVFTPYIVLSSDYTGSFYPRTPRGSIINMGNTIEVQVYDNNIKGLGIPYNIGSAPVDTGTSGNGSLYYREKAAIGAWKSYEGNRRINDNTNAPEGVNTGYHDIGGVRFKLYHPSPYTNETEKAAPENLKGKLVCQMDALEPDGSLLKYWDFYSDYYLGFKSGITNRPLFMEMWTASKTDGELGSGREKYMAENSPLGKCNMIIFATSSTLENDVIFKQSEYNPTFNVTTGTYEVWDAKGKPDPNCYHITDYATARDSDYRNDLKNLQVQDLAGTFKITVKNRLKNGIAVPSQSETIDTSSGAKFVCAGDVYRTEGQQPARIDLLGTQVSWNAQAGHRNLCYWYPCNYLYLPKGVESPYSESDGRPSLMCQFPFDVNVEKDLK